MDTDDTRPGHGLAPDQSRAQPAPVLPVVLVLASGRGERFMASGAKVHKLKALLDGKPVLEHTLDAVRASGLRWHLEDAGHPGMGDSIAAAVRASRAAIGNADVGGWLVLPGDLPLIQPGTLRQVADVLVRKGGVVVPFFDDERGHPVAFDAACGDALMALQGDRGAAAVLQAHQAQGRWTRIDVYDQGTVTDIDTLDDLQRAGTLLRQRGG